MEILRMNINLFWLVLIVVNVILEVCVLFLIVISVIGNVLDFCWISYIGGNFCLFFVILFIGVI